MPQGACIPSSNLRYILIRLLFRMQKTTLLANYVKKQETFPGWASVGLDEPIFKQSTGKLLRVPYIDPALQSLCSRTETATLSCNTPDLDVGTSVAGVQLSMDSLSLSRSRTPPHPMDFPDGMIPLMFL